jgi:hypothetical protein
MRILTPALIFLIPAVATAQTNSYGNPEKRAPRPTSAAISEADLMSLLYVVADDSVEGRNAPPGIILN